jgi:4-hydroxy-2-oxoheptanedioate aldolase
MTDPTDFATRLRNRERLIGSWIATDNPIGTEGIAKLGFDYLCVDGQHGLLDQSGWLAAITAIAAGGNSAPLIRVPGNDPDLIGRALDAGATGVVIPLVNNAAEAAAAAKACRYPPHGNRSYGPMRPLLRTGLTPAEASERVACLVMIETAGALEQIDEVCAVNGLDGVLIGPYDLTLALGGSGFGDPAVADELDTALSTVAAAAQRAGIAGGVHCNDGATAAKRLAAGFTFTMVSCDLMFAEEAATTHLRDAREATLH